MADITYVRAVFGALRTTTTVPLYKETSNVLRTLDISKPHDLAKMEKTIK